MAEKRTPAFREWYEDRHVFWPARDGEPMQDVYARLCDSVADYVDEVILPQTRENIQKLEQRIDRLAYDKDRFNLLCDQVETLARTASFLSNVIKEGHGLANDLHANLDLSINQCVKTLDEIRYN